MTVTTPVVVDTDVISFFVKRRYTLFPAMLSDQTPPAAAASGKAGQWRDGQSAVLEQNFR
jgi:hypothetical protein